MSVWLCIPSCRPVDAANDALDRWRRMGYKLAILRQGEPVEADLLIPTGDYLGWAKSTNILAREVLKRDPKCNWVVGGGDDTWPDQTHSPDSIAVECEQHFTVDLTGVFVGGNLQACSTGTAGVMQPTGDRWGNIDTIAGSPWMGREWCERAYQGNGPMFDGYFHLMADLKLCQVAEKLGVYWRRPDLVHYHNHQARAAQYPYQVALLLAQGHLGPIYSDENMARETAYFEKRKAAGFPGHEPL